MPSILKLSATIALIALSSLQPVASSSLAARAHGKRLTVPKTSPKSATTLETQAFPQQSGIEATEGKSTTPASKKSTKTAGEKSPAKAALNTTKPKSTTKGSGDKTSKKSTTEGSGDKTSKKSTTGSGDKTSKKSTTEGSGDKTSKKSATGSGDKTAKKSATEGSGDKTSKKSASRDSAEEVAANLNAAPSEEPETENGSTEEVKAY